MRLISKLVALGVLSVAVMGLASQPVHAGLLPTKVTIAPESGNFRWTYAVIMTSETLMKTGDFFTIYDFNGLVPGSATSLNPNFAFSSSLTGNTPARVLPNDDPSVPNLTWTYTGPNLTGQQGLGNFSAVSIYDYSIDGNFTASSARTFDGKINVNITDTSVPTPAPPIPEPATIALVGMGIPLLGLRRWMRRKRS